MISAIARLHGAGRRSAVGRRPAPHAALAARDRPRELRRAFASDRRHQQLVERSGQPEHEVGAPAGRESQETGAGERRLAFERRPVCLAAEQLATDLVLLDLAARAALGAAHDVAAIEQPQRQLERREMRRQQPGEERREVRAQGEELAVAIGEAVELGARRRREERFVGREVVDHRQHRLAKSPRLELRGELAPRACAGGRPTRRAAPRLPPAGWL